MTAALSLVSCRPAPPLTLQAFRELLRAIGVPSYFCRLISKTAVPLGLREGPRPALVTLLRGTSRHLVEPSGGLPEQRDVRPTSNALRHGQWGTTVGASCGQGSRLRNYRSISS